MKKDDRARTLKGALAALQAGQLEPALVVLGTWIARHPSDADAYSLRGQALAAAKRSTEALADFEMAANLAPHRLGFQFNLGMAYLNAGKAMEARDALGTLDDGSSQDADLLEALGMAHLALHDPATAKSFLERALVVDPRRASVLAHLGDARQKSGDEAAAIAAYKQALEIDPNHVPALNNLGAAYIAKGAYENAVACLQTAIKAMPNHARAHINLGMAQLHMRDPEGALTSFENCLVHDPLNRWGVAYRDLTLVELGRRSPEDAAIALAPLIHSQDLMPPTATFADELVRELQSHPNRRKDVSGTATTKGDDALDLFAHKGPALVAFEKLLRAAIDDHITTMPDIKGHPLYGWKPKDYRLDIWATYLRSGGYQYAHIHPTGWLSGVYYVQLPSAAGESAMGAGGVNNDVAGWIEFGPPDEGFPVTKRPEAIRFEPQLGRLLLFPSYAYHRTVPFDGETDRISIAFDVRP